MKKYVFILTVLITVVSTAQIDTFPGKVGIGTTTPERSLEIANGGALIRGLEPNFTIKSTIPGYGSWIDIATATCNGCWSKFAKKGSMVMRAVSYRGDFYITNPGNTGITFATGNWNGPTNPQKERMRITNTGNVGIGTLTPKAKLTVDGGSGFFTNPTLELKSDSNKFGWALLQLKGGTFDDKADYMIGRGTPEYNAGRALTIHVPSRQHFYGGTGNLPQISFVSSGANTLGYVQSETGNWYMKGNVGIGTDTPDEKLAVNGNIHAKEVRVDLTGWPDYVFEDTYTLPTLQQVENHITEKGHLINIPSAAEVEEKGIQLGEMNKKLLEKIEELTLYTIAQEKKIQALETKVSKNEELEDRLNKLEALLKKN